MTGRGRPAQLVAQVGLSAPRVAVIFAGGPQWHYRARLALHAASKFWGGRGFLLLPHVDGAVDPVLLRAARTYDPDYVVLLATTLGQAEREHPGLITVNIDGEAAEGEQRAQLVEQIADQLVDDPAGERARQQVVEVCTPYRSRRHGETERLTLLGPGEEARPLTPMSQIPAAPTGPCLSVPAAWGGAVAVAVAARCGSLDEPEPGPGPALEPPHERRLIRWLLSRDPRFRSPPPQVLAGRALPGVDPLELATAFDRTTYELGQISYGYRPRHRLTVVVGDSAADFAAAYARDIMYGDALWLPIELSPAGPGVNADEVATALRLAGVTKAAFRQGKVTVTTVSAAFDAVDAVVDLLRRPEPMFGGSAAADQRQLLAEAVARAELAFPVEGVMSWAVQADVDHPVAVAATDDDGTVTMLSPAPAPDVTAAGLRQTPGLAWQVELRPQTDIMPRGRGLDGDQLLAPAQNPYLTWVRSGRDGIRYESHRYDFIAAGTPRLSQLARPVLRELSLLPWAAAVIAPQDRCVRLSDAGRRAEMLRGLFDGDRRRLTEIVAGPLRPILHGFLTRTARTTDRYPDGGGVVLHAAGTNDAGHEGYLTFAGMQRLDLRGDHGALLTDTDELCTAGLLTLGIVVNCGVCGRVTFTNLDQASRAITCPRCRGVNPLTSSRWGRLIEGPGWYYDLHPVARDLLRENGDVPLLLAQHLHTASRRYRDVAEFELCDSNGAALAEVDLLAHLDGQVAVAEAKTSNTFGKRAGRAAAKRVTLAAALHADQIILATTEPTWDQAALTAIRGAVHAHAWPADAEPAVRIITALGTPGCQDQRMQASDGALTPW